MMFRELQRKNKELSRGECLGILEDQKRGVLSVNGDGGYPYAMPMNHFYEAAEGKLYFHCGLRGHRLDALARDPRVCFCVCDEGRRKEDHWALLFRSVIVFGKIRVLDDPAKIREIAAKLSRKFTTDEAYIQREIDLYADHTLLLELTPEHICGKLVEES